MTADQVYQIVDWLLRLIMAVVSVVFVVVQREKAAADKAMERRFVEVGTRFEHAERTEIDAFKLRDERLETLRQQIANNAAQSSKTEGKVTVMIDDIRQHLAHLVERTTRIETEIDGRQHRRNS